ncbi:hypothetical protein CC1G_01065 [Coprinopsis cinerea okayama7|uniref:Uncharacterized protein n=1 Tax=Coprinopsis cinerea (strain Okayama-7 / 130 / ATCC MYA-4618 / FGSC 9003) TaxID=240176 RepID=A8NEE3_COPC7|nr:hypothetical protein CC1G_01065 [Coprinopsis cinerea okayama7\|eukprot:XP_001833003.1 hypothetical protein CC1G_01065 [Coprinopsis cinerea okayama7\
MAAVATRQLSKTPVGVLPPASPFAELLRRSRFASYDPEIKQTYSAPPAYAHRGNWGLKRPISQRRKDAYITLKSYEDHAQYIEWNNAEGSVRFVKRFEQLNMKPEVGATWEKNLGPIQDSLWLTDSEFDQASDSEYRYHTEEKPVEEAEEKDVLLEDLGKKGKGGYGADATYPTRAPLVEQKTKPWNYRQPNLEAMTNAEFERYLEKLRELRPAFLAELRTQLREKEKRGETTGTLLRPDMSDLQLAAANIMSSDHRAFLNNFWEEEYARRDTEPAAADPANGEALPRDFVQHKIKPQPHRFGGLIYSHPSLLDTFYSTAPKPAFVLQVQNSGKFTGQGTQQVSFAGVVADLQGPGERPLFARGTGPRQDALDRSVVNVRLSSFILDKAPSVVGKHQEGLDGVHVKAAVVPDRPLAQRSWPNTSKPGTYGYSAIVQKGAVTLDGYGKPGRKQPTAASVASLKKLVKANVPKRS